MDVKGLIDLVVDCAKRVRSCLTPGYEEKVYKNAMFIELTDAGLNVEVEKAFNVVYKGRIVGSYRADLVVEGKLIVELKAINDIIPINEVQLVNYLTATGIDDGLLINFGASRLQVRHKYRLYNRLQ